MANGNRLIQVDNFSSYEMRKEKTKEINVY